jgi:hypothetical protein
MLMLTRPRGEIAPEGKAPDHKRPGASHAGESTWAYMRQGGSSNAAMHHSSPFEVFKDGGAVAPLVPRHRYDAPTIWLIVCINARAAILSFGNVIDPRRKRCVTAPCGK